MKKLILGIFMMQIIVLMAVGIPAGGAVNGIWKDPSSDIVVQQNNPFNTIESYYRLLDQESYDTAILLFEKVVRDHVTGDILKASLESSGFQDYHLAKLIPSGIIGDNAVVASIRINDSNPDEPELSLATLRQVEGKWELVQQMNDSNLEEVKQIFERALEVCNLVEKDTFKEFSEIQKTNIRGQAEFFGQYLTENLDQLTQMMDSVK